MWIFTNKGFISAVQHRESPDQLMVRARRLDHIRELFPEMEVTELASADYRYRVTVHKLDFKRVLLGQIDAIDYDNFKNSIPDHTYHDACSSVWSVMHRLQPGRAYPQSLTADLFEAGEPDDPEERPDWDDLPWRDCPECEGVDVRTKQALLNIAATCSDCGHKWQIEEEVSSNRLGMFGDPDKYDDDDRLPGGLE